MADLVPIISNSSFVGVAPFTVQFDASKSYSVTGSIQSYSWDFGDEEESTIQRPSHTFEEPGIYVVSLTVTDNRDIQETTTIILNAIDPQSFIRINSDLNSLGIKAKQKYSLPIQVESLQTIDLLGIQIIFDIDKNAFLPLTDVDIDLNNSLMSKYSETVYETVTVSSSYEVSVNEYIQEVYSVIVDGESTERYVGEASFQGQTIYLPEIIHGFKEVNVKYKSAKINYAFAEIDSGNDAIQRVAVAIGRPVSDVIEINNRESGTYSKYVVLRFNMKAKEMKIWNDEGSGSSEPAGLEWEEFQATKIWSLYTPTSGELEGTKTVYCKFRDKDENVIDDNREPFSARIILDYGYISKTSLRKYNIGKTPQSIFNIELTAVDTLSEESYQPIRFVTSYDSQFRCKVLDSVGKERFILGSDDVIVFKRSNMNLSSYNIIPSVESALLNITLSNIDTTTKVETWSKFINASRELIEVWNMNYTFENSVYTYTIDTNKYPSIGTYLYIYAYDSSRLKYLPLFYIPIYSDNIDKINKQIIIKRSEKLEDTYEDVILDNGLNDFDNSHYLFCWRAEDYLQELAPKQQNDENSDLENVQVSRVLEPLTEDTFYIIDSTIRDISGYEINTTSLINSGELNPWKAIFNTLPDIIAPNILSSSKEALLDRTALKIDTNTVTIEWYTDEPSTSEVVYFCNPRFIKKEIGIWVEDGSGNQQFESRTVDVIDPSIIQRKYVSNLSTRHVVNLEGLASGTKYFFKIKSKDKKNNTVEAPKGPLSESTLPSTQEEYEELTSTVEGQKELLYSDLMDVTKGREPFFYEFVTKIDLTVRYTTSNIVEDVNNRGQYLLYVPLKTLISRIEMGSYGLLDRLTMSTEIHQTTELHMTSGINIAEDYLLNPDPITIDVDEYDFYNDNDYYKQTVDLQPQYIYLIDGYARPRGTGEGTFKDLDGDGVGDSWDNKGYLSNTDVTVELRANARRSNLIASVFYNEVELYDKQPEETASNVEWISTYRQYFDYFDNIDVKKQYLTLRLPPVDNYPLDILERVFNERHQMIDGKIILYRWDVDFNTISIKNFKSGKIYLRDIDYTLTVSGDKVEINSLTIPDNMDLNLNYTYAYKSLVCNYLTDDQSPFANGQFEFSSKVLYFNISL